MFTDAYDKAWQPSTAPFMTAVITFADVQGKTRVTSRALHWTAADRAKHEQMGFHQGWGESMDKVAEGRAKK